MHLHKTYRRTQVQREGSKGLTAVSIHVNMQTV